MYRLCPRPGYVHSCCSSALPLIPALSVVQPHPTNRATCTDRSYQQHYCQGNKTCLNASGKKLYTCLCEQTMETCIHDC